MTHCSIEKVHRINSISAKHAFQHIIQGFCILFLHLVLFFLIREITRLHIFNVGLHRTSDLLAQVGIPT